MLDNDTSQRFLFDQAEGLQFSDRSFGGLRLLGGDNNNNKNQGNNNANNNNNKNQGNNNNNQGNYYLDASFNQDLFSATAAFCLVTVLILICRIKTYRRRERRRIRLGYGPKVPRKKKHNDGDSPTGGGQNELLTDEELKKYILPLKEEESIHDAARVARFDKETQRILNICKPYSISAVVSAIASIINTALIGKQLGLDALAIYYIVAVPTSLTGTIIWAVLETVSSLGGQAIGAGSYKLTGQYCQISIILYTLLFIPHAVFWIYCLKPILQWFAPDLGDDVINEGYNYFLVSLVGTYISAYSSVLHDLLEVVDQFKYGMISTIAQEIVGVISFVAYLKITPGNQKSIVWVEIIDTILLFLFLIADILVVKKMKWFNGFWKGIMRSVAIKNWDAVWLVLKTAAPLSMGNILLTIEWELLAIFSAYMGETYVAAWGIAGTIWGILEYATDCVASAGELRVAKLLGNGNPRLAKLSAYKCMFLGNLFASLMSVAFLVGMPVIPRVFTDDEDVASLIANLLPYCALGNLTLTIGSLAWTLVGAQGRYSIATFHGCIGSLAVTIPFAAVSTYYFKGGLEGLAAAVVIGYMISGFFNSITLFLSDWEYISYRVMVRNGVNEPVEEEQFLKYEGVEGGSLWGRFKLGANQGIDTGFNLIDSEENEMRKVVIGPGKLGYLIQSTKEGPMIVGTRKREPSGFGFFGTLSAKRASVLEGQLYVGDLILQVNDTPTAKSTGRAFAELLHELENETYRTLAVRNRDRTGLTTVYRPGPYGTAVVTGAIQNKFEDDAVIGGGYFSMS